MTPYAGTVRHQLFVMNKPIATLRRVAYATCLANRHPQKHMLVAFRPGVPLFCSVNAFGEHVIALCHLTLRHRRHRLWNTS